MNLQESFSTHYTQWKARKNLRGDAYLDALADRAFAQFKQTGLPRIQDETWKYTPIRPLNKYNFNHRPAIESIDISRIPAHFKLPDIECNRIVFCNGQYSPELSDHSTLETSLKILPIASNSDEPFIRSYIDQKFKTSANAFANLNTAFIDQGFYIEVDEDAAIKKPLFILYISQASHRQSASHIRILLNLKDNAKLDLIEHYVSHDGEHGLTNTLMQGIVSANAQLNHTRLQQQADKSHLIVRNDLQLFDKSHYHLMSLETGGLWVRNEFNLQLIGEHATAELLGVFSLKHKQHLDNHLTIEHQGKHCQSEQSFKGIVNDQSRGIFNSKVIVKPGADGSQATQHSHNLLLSKRAEIDTKPELEIYAEDVKCAHGATIGQLDPAQLFYLQSRGIDCATAKRILTSAFCIEIIERAQNPEIAQWLIERFNHPAPDGVPEESIG